MSRTDLDGLGYRGKTVVLTGGASGIGEAAARILADLGATVHVADIAACVIAAMNVGAGTIYNVCDDEPCAQADVVAFACKLLGKPAPKLVPWEEAAPKMSEMARSFYAENRRVRNDRIKRQLGVQLRYPSYREGLTAIYGGQA